MRPTRLMLDSGTVVSISKIVAYKSSGDAGRHQRSVRLPTSSEVQSVSLDVQQCGHDCLHQERMEHSILLSAEVVWLQGNQAGASPSTRSAQHPGGCTVQDQPDSQHWVDVDHGTSTTSVFQVGRTADRHVCYVCQQMTDQVFLTISGPQGRVDGCDVHYLGQREGPPVCVLAIQAGPSGTAEDLPVSWSTDDIGSSQARNSFLVSGASGTVATRSNPNVCRRSATAHPRRHSAQHCFKFMKHIGEDSSIFVGQNDGKSSMSEVIIIVNISYIYSETDCFHRPSSHIAHQWLLCCVTGSTIVQRIQVSPHLDPDVPERMFCPVIHWNGERD